jgi:hypothetical protein
MRLPALQLARTNNPGIRCVGREHKPDLAVLPHLRREPVSKDDSGMRPEKVHRKKTLLGPKRAVRMLATNLRSESACFRWY